MQPEEEPKSKLFLYNAATMAKTTRKGQKFVASGFELDSALRICAKRQRKHADLLHNNF